MVTEAQIRAAVPRFSRPTRNWSGLCEAAIWNLFDVLGPGGPSSPSATVARKRSKLEGAGWGPGDNVVWWSGVWGYENGKQVDFGHVAYHLGDGWAFMASSQVTSVVDPFINIGFVDLKRYEKRFPNMRLEGWSYDHAGATLRPTNGGANTSPHQEDELPTTAQVWDEPQQSLGKNAPSIVLRDANSAAQEARDGINEMKWVKHRNIDAPTDVVLADALVTAQLGNAKLDALTAAVATLAASAGLDPAWVEAAVESAVKDAVAGGIQISTTLSDDSLAAIGRAVADEQSRRLAQ